MKRTTHPRLNPPPDDPVTEAALSFGQVWEKERQAPMPAFPDRLAAAAKSATVESHRKQQRGDLTPLGINPATGKRFNATGRYPTTGFYSPILPRDEPSTQIEPARRKGRRGRVNELRERMRAFSAIYNAGYMVRLSYFGSEERQRDAVMELVAVMLQELRSTQDYEALLFAVADALYASPLGVPWEP
jgi:hypothetical protein